VRELAGRVAVVTGAASGIGRATAELLARRGCDLALVDVDEAGLGETASVVRAAGRRASTHHADVASRERMRTLPEEVKEEHGRMHVLVNNAGVSVGALLEDHSLEDFDWIVGVNFWGVVHGCKFFLPHLRLEEEAHIANVSSVFGFVGFPGQSSYCATKSAVRALSEALWVELRDSKIGVTCVHPGAVSTSIVRRSRTSDPAARDRAAERIDRLGRDPGRVARRVVRAIERGSPRVLIHPETRLAEWTKRAAPVATQRLVAWLYRRFGPIG
jgi:NAD(P)-dependent dehydrogenase (short-subunit alcohol dehydrogenase family)